jgi:two-component system response regulator DegU
VMRTGLQTKSLPKKFTGPATSVAIELTDREKEVLVLLCQGYSSAKIAEQLFISFRTVEGHRKHLLEKTGATNAVSLAVFAINNKLLQSHS